LATTPPPLIPRETKQARHAGQDVEDHVEEAVDSASMHRSYALRR
jgi:hypothetical protein